MTTRDRFEEEDRETGERVDDVTLLLLAESGWRPIDAQEFPLDEIRAMYENSEDCERAGWERLYWLRRVRPPTHEYRERPIGLDDNRIYAEQVTYEERAAELGRKALAAGWLLFMEPSRKKPVWLRVHDLLDVKLGLLETVVLAIPRLFVSVKWGWRAKLWYKSVAWGFVQWLSEKRSDRWTASFAGPGNTFLPMKTLGVLNERWDPEARGLLESWLGVEGFDLGKNDIEARLSCHLYIGRLGDQ